MASIDRVRDLLNKEWDPTGLFRLAGVEDEYDEYAETVLAMIERGAATGEIEGYLCHVEGELMKLTVNEARLLHVVEMLGELGK